MRTPNDSVLVRLVPKPADGDTSYLQLAAAARSLWQRFLPDPGRGVAALKLLYDFGVRSWQMTPMSGIEGEVSVAKFEEIFGARVVADRDGHFTTEQALQLPEVLQELIAFAYIPKPPELHAASPLPPATETFHLRLEDVAMMLGASRCHREGWTGKGVPVAVVDTGFASHPYFEEQGFRISRVGPQPTVDIDGHGTGISANVLAVAPDCHLIGVKRTGSSANSLERALQQNPRVLSCSWGWDLDRCDLMELEKINHHRYWELVEIESILLRAIDRGTAVLFSAGNGQRSAPASMEIVMAVGGVTVGADGSIRASNFASAYESVFYPGRYVPDFCGVVGEVGQGAPGHIMLPVPEHCSYEGENMTEQARGWGIFSGTSAAVPQLAGVCALLMEIDPKLGHDDIKTILSSTCRDVVTGSSYMEEEAVEGPDLATGAGFVDAYAACRLAVERRKTGGASSPTNNPD